MKMLQPRRLVGGRAGNVLFLQKLLVIINSLNFMCLLFRTFPYTNFVLS